MHRMHRIFSGDGWLVFPDILKSARDHRPSQRLLQQPPVLIILCILCIDVPFIVLLDGSAQSRGAGRPARGQTGVSQRGQAGFQRSRPPDTPHLTIGTTPRERGRPARMLSLRLPLSFPAMLQPTALPAGSATESEACRPVEAEGEPWRRSMPVDPSVLVETKPGDGRGLREEETGCAGGTPALPGTRASSHDRVTPTGQKCRSRHFGASCR